MNSFIDISVVTLDDGGIFNLSVPSLIFCLQDSVFGIFSS